MSNLIGKGCELAADSRTVCMLDGTDTWVTLMYYAVLLAVVYGGYLWNRGTKQRANRAVLREAMDSGMASPPSLHPVIDHNKCIGCEACVHACPEFPAHRVLGVIRRKAHLVSPSDCIGHGACQAACPVGAISLVFGTAERGVDIPMVSAEFETNVPGIYIAGELGGMGLIRNAVEQGRQAMENIARRLRRAKGALDVAIVGAGPAGIAATLAAHEKGLRYVAIEQNSLGGTVANFPRGKLVMTAPAKLPIYGEMKFKETQKEALIEFWRRVEAQTGINIHYGERLENIECGGKGFLLKTSNNSYRVSAVLLALGRRGTPRKLGVPGEELPKVVYSLLDPAEYAGKHVCVVGGGDSALEAAHTIAEQKGAVVTLSYRSGAFSRAKRQNRDKVERLASEGRLRVELNSQISRIGRDAILLSCADGERRVKNDAVIVCVGGILPTGFLKDIGIQVETKYGTA